MTRRQAVASIAATPLLLAGARSLILPGVPGERDMMPHTETGIEPAADSLLLLYHTRAGQTRRITEFMAERMRRQGLKASVMDLAAWAADPPTVLPPAILLAAGIQFGKHGDDVEAIVRRHSALFERVPSAFVSVSLSAAHPAKQADAERYIEEFVARTGWTPDATVAVAGALRYTRYGLVRRFMMKKIAAQDGLPTDTSRDHEFTDWKQVAAFSDAFATQVTAAPVSGIASGAPA